MSLHETAYSRSITLAPLLTHEQEAELAALIQAGRQAAGKTGVRARRVVAAGKRAENTYIEANLRLVLTVANRLAGRTLMELDDLIQEGSIGLIHALSKFDWSRGIKFSTYAVPWIQHYISRAIDNQGRLIRLPVNVEDDVRRVRRAREHLDMKLGRMATDEDVAAHLGVTVDHVRRLDAYSQLPVSLSTEDHDIEVPAVDAAVDDEPEEVDSGVTELLASAVSKKERPVLELLYGLGDQPHLTDAETAEAIGCSERTITRLKSSGLQKLREAA